MSEFKDKQTKSIHALFLYDVQIHVLDCGALPGRVRHCAHSWYVKERYC